MPLHDMLQCMALGFLEVVAPVEWIKPRIEEELGPVATPDQQTTTRQAFSVLREDEVYALAAQVRESLDDAVGRHDRFVDDHQALQLPRLEEFRVKWLARVHDQRRAREVEQPRCMWPLGHGMSDRRHHAPGQRHAGHEIVIRRVGEEGRVTVPGCITPPVLHDVVDVHLAHFRIERRDDHDVGRAGGYPG